MSRIDILSHAKDIDTINPSFYFIEGDMIQHPTHNLHDRLQPIHDASHTRNRRTSPPDSECFPGTRTEVIEEIDIWADSDLQEDNHVCCLYGTVGCGKSAVAQAVSGNFQGGGRLLASFFFFRGSGERSTMVKFVVTLASQIAATLPETTPFIDAALNSQPGLLSPRALALETELHYLIFEPLKSVINTPQSPSSSSHLPKCFIIVIDGLDECQDKEEVEAFIDGTLAFFKSNPTFPLRFFITSRVEQHVQGRLQSPAVILKDLVSYGSARDIETFLEVSFSHAVKRNRVLEAYVRQYGNWPTPNDRQQLVRHIKGSFIFASTLVKFILWNQSDGLTPMARLPLALTMNPGLDGLYAQTLGRSENLPHFIDIISTIALADPPISISRLAELHGIQTYEVFHVLLDLQTIVQVPGTDTLPVTLYHTSLRDFLTTESRSQRFFVSPTYYLQMSYRYAMLARSRPELQSKHYTHRSRGRWSDFLVKYGLTPSSILEGLECRSPSEAGSYHTFLTLALLSTLLYGDLFHKQSSPLLRASLLVVWPKQLALALESDPSSEAAADGTFREEWLEKPIFNVFELGPTVMATCVVHIPERSAELFQRNLKLARAAVDTKLSTEIQQKIQEEQANRVFFVKRPRVTSITCSQYVTPIEALHIFELLVSCHQQRQTRSPRDLKLSISRSKSSIHISLKDERDPRDNNQDVRGQAAQQTSWTLSEVEKKKYDDIFRSWDTKGAGFIDSSTALEMFSASGLPQKELAQIWQLADVGDRGKLDIADFHTAMGLIYRRLKGNPIPNELPPELKSPSSSLEDSVEFMKNLLRGNEPRPDSPKNASFNSSGKVRDRDALIHKRNNSEPASARSPPPAPKAPAELPGAPKSSPSAPPKNMSPQERQAFARAEAQRRIRDRLRSLGLQAPPSSSTTPVDTSVEDRLAQEKKKAEEKARRERLKSKVWAAKEGRATSDPTVDR